MHGVSRIFTVGHIGLSGGYRFRKIRLSNDLTDDRHCSLLS